MTPKNAKKYGCGGGCGFTGDLSFSTGKMVVFGGHFVVVWVVNVVV
jgi:hypothetical protein